MIKSALKRRTHQARLKLALIPLLCLVLVAVLCWPTKPSVDGAPTTAIAAQDSILSAGAQSRVMKPKWPSARLEEILAFNPFEPNRLQVEDATVATSTVSTVENKGVASLSKQSTPGKLQAIYINSQGAAAILDSRVIHVGDVLPGGERIVEITSLGIKLE